MFFFPCNRCNQTAFFRSPVTTSQMIVSRDLSFILITRRKYFFRLFNDLSCVRFMLHEYWHAVRRCFYLM